MMVQTYTLPLKSPQATIETIGGKGASLARFLAAKLPVPDGFHVTTAVYNQFVATHGLQEAILASTAMANLDKPEEFEKASKQINDLFVQNEMPKEIAEAICQAYTHSAAVNCPWPCVPRLPLKIYPRCHLLGRWILTSTSTERLCYLK